MHFINNHKDAQASVLTSHPSPQPHPIQNICPAHLTHWKTAHLRCMDAAVCIQTGLCVSVYVLKEQREKNETDGHKQKSKPGELVFPGVSSGMTAHFETTSVWEAVYDVMSAVSGPRKKNTCHCCFSSLLSWEVLHIQVSSNETQTPRCMR